MSNLKTKIEWTDKTWSPTTGCDKVSPGCASCYAVRDARRLAGNPNKKVAAGAFLTTERHPNGQLDWTGIVNLHEDRLLQPLSWRKPSKVFVNSMSDLFHESVPVEFILAVWAVMEAAPQHTFQILTKRAKRMREVLSASPVARDIPAGATATYKRREIPNWPGYYADTDGVIWSDRRGRLRPLSPCVTSKWGHAHVTLHAGAAAEPQQVKVHRLVLTTFDRPPHDGEEACHINGDASDNKAWNLRWGSRADNSADRTAHGNAVTAPTLTIRQVADVRIAALGGESQRDIGSRYGISHTQVGRIVSGESWGFKVLPNAWLGVSCENQYFADERIPLLLQTPAAVRFISAEPLLGPIDLQKATWPEMSKRTLTCDFKPHLGLDWCIVGGESGPGARGCDLEWIRSIVEQCHAARVPVFVKQLGAKPNYQRPRATLAAGSGVECEHGYDVCPTCDAGTVPLRDRKGGDPSEWPEYFRRREFPEVRS